MSKLIDKNEQNVIFGNDVLPDNISKGSETSPKTAMVTIPDPAEDKVLATSDGVEGEEEPKKKPSWYKRAKASFKADYTEDEEGNRTYIDDCVKPLPEKEEVEKEESGFLKATKKAKNKLDEFTNSCGFKNVKNVIKGVAQYKEMAEMGEDRWKAAVVGLSTMLPFQIPEACQNIIDNFASKLRPKHNGYMTNGSTGLIESDEVQCALDALEMMLGIPGLKGKINNFIEDVEATATIIAGMVTTLIDYELLDNLETIFGQCKTLTTLRRAVGMAQGAITSSGDIELLFMMTGLTGKISALEYDIKIVRNVIRSFRNKNRTFVENEGTPEEVVKTENEKFLEFLDFMDPTWDLADTGAFVPNEPIYSLEPITDLSPDAEKALEEHPAIKVLVVSNESILEMVDGNGSYLIESNTPGEIRSSEKKVKSSPLASRSKSLFAGKPNRGSRTMAGKNESSSSGNANIGGGNVDVIAPGSTGPGGTGPGGTGPGGTGSGGTGSGGTGPGGSGPGGTAPGSSTSTPSYSGSGGSYVNNDRGVVAGSKSINGSGVEVIDRYNNIVAKEKFDDKTKPKISPPEPKGPSVADITRFMYPNATGPGMGETLPMSDPMYFYV